jgi:hypothetical protein
MPWAAIVNTPSLSVGLDGLVYEQHDDRIEVWTPEVSQQHSDGVYSTPIAELSTFNVSPQRVPNELPRRDAGS